MSLGRYGNTGWGTAWIAALERLSTAWQNRLPRGKDYAAKGHVLSVHVKAGRIEAKVQGSRSKPYSTSIEIPPFREADWERLLLALAQQSYYPAYLLAGVMPPAIDEAFRHFGLSLLPIRNSEMLGSCSCPDKARPCKHIAAVHFSFAEALESDPFLVWQLRGIDKRSIGRLFRRSWFGDEAAALIEEQRDAANIDRRGIPVSTLTADRFNRTSAPIESISFKVQKSENPLFILQRLGQPPSWRLPVDALTLFGPIYEEVTRSATDLATAVDSFSAEAELGMLDDDEFLDTDELLDEHADADEPDDDGEDDTDDDDDDFEPAEPAPAEPAVDEEPDELPPAMPSDEADVGEDDTNDHALVPAAPGDHEGRFRSLAPVLPSAPSAPPPPQWSAEARPWMQARTAPPSLPTASPAVPSSLPSLQRRPSRTATPEPESRPDPARHEAAVLIRRGSPQPQVSRKGGAPAGPAIVRRGEAVGSTELRIARTLAIGDARGAFEASRAAWRSAPTEERLLLLLESAAACGELGSIPVETEFAVAGVIERGDAPEACLLLALLLGGQVETAAEIVHGMGLDAWNGELALALCLVAFAVGCAGFRRPGLHGRTTPEIEALWNRPPRLSGDIGRPPHAWGHWFVTCVQERPLSAEASARVAEVCRHAVAELTLQGGRSEEHVRRARGLVHAVAALIRSREGDTAANQLFAECGMKPPTESAPHRGHDPGPRRRDRR